MRRAAIAAIAAIGAAWIALGALACAGDDGPESPARGEGGARAAEEGLSAQERERGREACERYVERVCACAEDDEAYEEECALARARPEALEIALGAVDSRGDLDRRQRGAALAEARRVIQRCFEADAALDPAVCPRPRAE